MGSLIILRSCQERDRSGKVREQANPRPGPRPHALTWSSSRARSTTMLSTTTSLTAPAALPTRMAARLVARPPGDTAMYNQEPAAGRRGGGRVWGTVTQGGEVGGEADLWATSKSLPTYILWARRHNDG